jgi:hypothetical protein
MHIAILIIADERIISYIEWIHSVHYLRNSRPVCTKHEKDSVPIACHGLNFQLKGFQFQVVLVAIQILAYVPRNSRGPVVVRPLRVLFVLHVFVKVCDEPFPVFILSFLSQEIEKFSFLFR